MYAYHDGQQRKGIEVRPQKWKELFFGSVGKYHLTRNELFVWIVTYV